MRVGRNQFFLNIRLSLLIDQCFKWRSLLKWRTLQPKLLIPLDDYGKIGYA
ncbi:hypothetical protein H6G70_17860 [Arthrospira platensis FACHB-439]|nr:hypothetical protein [Arthrospira platensis FACHB-439]